MYRRLLLLAVWLGPVGPVVPMGALADEQTSAPADGSEPPPVALERLLRVPGPVFELDVRRAVHGGKAREEWTEEFHQAHEDVAELERRLSVTQQELRDAGGGEYRYTPVPGSPGSDPEVLKHRAQIRRDRTSLEAARQRLRDLQIEASLAGVPDVWRHPPPSE